MEPRDGHEYCYYPFVTLTGHGVCTPTRAHTWIEFDGAELVRSNLGGQGGRCDTNSPVYDGEFASASQCVDGARTPSTPPEVYIRNVGTAPSGARIDLRITNESEYRAWNPNHNGIKRQTEGARTGYFGAINLLGPRLSAQRPFEKYWNEHFTFVQLRYEFLDGASGQPLIIGRTFITFCAPSPTPYACANTLMPPCLARVTFHETRPYPL